MYKRELPFLRIASTYADQFIGLSTVTPSNFSVSDGWINSFSILRLGGFCYIRACLGKEEMQSTFVLLMLMDILFFLHHVTINSISRFRSSAIFSTEVLLTGKVVSSAKKSSRDLLTYSAKSLI